MNFAAVPFLSDWPWMPLLLPAAILLVCLNSVVQFTADAVGHSDESRTHRIGLLGGAFSAAWSIVCLVGIYATSTSERLARAPISATDDWPSRGVNFAQASVDRITETLERVPEVFAHTYEVPHDAGTAAVLGFVALMVLRVAIYWYAKRRRLEAVNFWGSVNWTHATAIWLTAWLLIRGWQVPTVLVLAAFASVILIAPFLTWEALGDAGRAISALCRAVWSLIASGVRWIVKWAVEAVHTYLRWARSAKRWYHEGPGAAMRKATQSLSADADSRNERSEGKLVELDTSLRQEDLDDVA